MRLIATTTAIALVMSVPAFAQAVDDEPGAPAVPAGGEAGMDGAQQGAMQAGDLLASELMDAAIYAPASGEDAGQDFGAQTGQEMGDDAGVADGTGAAPGTGVDGQPEQQGQLAGRWGDPMGAEALEGMENIGNVDDLLLDEQGGVQAILVDVGGFLGIGARQVAIGLDQVQFVPDSADDAQIHVVTSIGADTLEAAPEFDSSAHDRTAQQQPQDQGVPDGQNGVQAEWRQDREPLAAPDMEREGYEQAEVSEISADDLIGANLYDVNDENVGNVDDVVLGANGEAEYIVADVGGFLGLGVHTVAIGFDEVTVMHDDGWNDLRLYVDVSQETLEAMPEHADS